MLRKLPLLLVLAASPCLAQGAPLNGRPAPPDPNREVTLTLGEIQQLIRAGSMHAVADEIATGPSRKIDEQLRREDKTK